MKLRAPAGCHAASHGGLAVSIAEDGTIDVDDKVALVFIAHGFRKAEVSHGTEATKSKSGKAGSLPSAKPVIQEIGSDEVGALSRKELFAFLRAKGISISLPATNTELRAAVRQSLGS
jgi:hypothetical protein